MNIINERVSALRTLMKEKGIDMYYIPTSDYHDSEYVNPFFRGRAWMSGFTGSAGVMVVTLDKAVVWSDGRYYIQAENQLKDTCIDFYRQGDPNYPTTAQFIVDTIKENETLAFDGKVVSTLFGLNLANQLKAKNVKIAFEEDLLDIVWTDRPALPKEKMFILSEKYCGESLASKVSRIVSKMKACGANKHILTTLDDIAWVLNLRGNDVVNNPVFLSYVMMDETNVYFYVDAEKIDEEVDAYLKANNVIVKAYNAIYEDVKAFDENDCVLLDKERVNYALVKCIPAHTKVVSAAAPSSLMKAMKNETELENLKEAHLKDGAAVTKFMYWLKTNAGKIEMDEISAEKYLLSCRKEQEHFLDESFGAIVGYNANAAMMHYSAKPDNFAVIKPEGMLLVDSGGQYLEGTTDITRTFAMGPVCDEWKKHFTLSLKGMIQLSKIKFLHGCTGINLDILARQPLWECNIDYQCGTGHGVGYLLNVHEGPHGIRWRKALNRKEDTILQPGMVVSNEPGVYVKDSHGIRIENMIYVTKDEMNEYGQFLRFETLTYTPIDIDLIDVKYLDDACIAWLNNYHKECYEKLSPRLNEEEKAWLKQYTRAI